MFTKDDLIHSYTRREALADGVLIDVTPAAREAGFVVPVAVTSAVWASCVEVPEGVTGQDEAGRLWDLLSLLAFGIRRLKPIYKPELRFSVRVVNDDRNPHPPLEQLKAVCGPDDDGRPCLTVMKPNED